LRFYCTFGKHCGLQGVSAKTFEPNISVICQRIFMKFKMKIKCVLKNAASHISPVFMARFK
jgi:hypothetical protein